uniref:Uncharacterized protein n=1 Tax=Salix viminalis TaxID=40686 RepID=A0A6N2MMA9_SALVM
MRHLPGNIMMPLIHRAHKKPISRFPQMKPPPCCKNCPGFFSPDEEYLYTFSEALSKSNGQKEKMEEGHLYNDITTIAKMIITLISNTYHATTMAKAAI